MSADHFFGQEDEEKARAGHQQSGQGTGQPAAESGATGIFGTVPQATERAVPGAAELIAPVSQTAVRPALPVVHSVVFKADSSRAEQTDELLNLLRSAPSSTPEPPPPAAAPSSGGFTQLLRALNFEQPQAQPKVQLAAPKPEQVVPSRVEEPLAAVAPHREQVTSFLPQAPVPPKAPATPEVPSDPAPVGSFTQMFQALEPKAVESAVPAHALPVSKSDELPLPAVAAAPSPGSFTQMFAAAGAPVAEVPKSETAPAAVPAPLATAPVVAAPGSFTQMFRTVSSPPEAVTVEVVPPAAPPVVAPPSSFTQMSSALGISPEQAIAAPEQVANVAPPPSIAAAPAGSFTQMFRTVSSLPEAVTPEAVPPDVPERAMSPAPPPAAAGPGSFTQMFRALDESPVETAPAKPLPDAAAASPGGSFTQMFQAVSPPPEAVVTEVGPPAVPARAMPPAAAGPGSFTQIFRTLDAAPVETAKVESRTPVSSAPGSFTQMFQAVGSPPVETPKDTAGSFTRMLGTEPATNLHEPAREPSSSYSGNAGAGNSDASQMFSVYRPASEPPRAAPVFAPVEPTPPAMQRPAQAPLASSGGLTQLLRALDQPANSAPRPYMPPAPVAPVAGQQPGSFTAVYGALGGEAAAPPVSPPPVFPQQGFTPPPAAGRDTFQGFHLPQTAAPPAAPPPAQSGPSEFTRILNASTLREAALRGPATGAPAAPEGQPPPAAAAPGAPQWAMPGAPKMPAAPTMPTAPKAPELKLPEAPKMATPAAGKMQQYLPLLLILIIFLLLAILVAVIFLMKK